MEKDDNEHFFIIEAAKLFKLVTGNFKAASYFSWNFILKSIIMLFRMSTAVLCLGLCIGESRIARIGDLFERLIMVTCFVCIEGMSYGTSPYLRPMQFDKMYGELARTWALTKKNTLLPDNLKLLEKSEKKCKNLYFYFRLSGLFIAASITLSPIMLYYFLPRIKQVRLPFQIYLPFKPAHKLFVIVYVAVTLHFAFICSMSLTQIGMHFGFMYHIKILFKVNCAHFGHAFSKYLEKLPNIETFKLGSKRNFIHQKLQDRLIITAIKENQHLYRVTEEFANVFKNVTFSLMTGGTIVIVMALFLVILNPPIYARYYVFIIVCLGNFHVLFTQAAAVSNMSQSLHTEAYFNYLQMYIQNPQVLDRSYIMVLLRSQKPIVFRAGNAWKLTLVTYVKFLQQIYTFLTVLGQMKPKNAGNESFE